MYLDFSIESIAYNIIIAIFFIDLMQALATMTIRILMGVTVD